MGKHGRSRFLSFFFEQYEAGPEQFLLEKISS
jgi:hypothetical protein